MSMDQNIYETLEEKFTGLAPANCIALALRASLRALPLLMLHSSSDKQPRVTIKPFGYWSDTDIQENLLATLSAHGLAIRLLAPCPTHYVNAVSPIFEHVKKIVYKASDTLDFSCKRAYSNEYLFSDACGRGYTASTVCASAVIASIYTNLQSIGLLQSNFETAAEKKVKVKAYAKEFHALRTRLINASRAASKNNFAEENAVVTAFTINEAKRLSQRFTLYVDIISHRLGDNSNSKLKELLETAQAAARAFHSVCESTLVLADQGFLMKLSEALDAAARYEDARMAMLPFGDEIDTDFYVEAPQHAYALLKALLVEPSELVAKVNHCIKSATHLIEGFDDAIQAPQMLDFSAAFDNYDTAYRMLDEFIGFALKPDSSELSASLAALYQFSTPAKLSDIRDADIETYSSDIAYYAIDAIGHMISGCHANLEVYSKYDIYTFRELSLEAVLSDLDFLNKRSLHELFTRRLWSPPLSTNAINELTATQSLYPGATKLWQMLWNDFKRDALAVDSGLSSWLDWYDGLFFRGATNIPALDTLIKTSYPQQYTCQQNTLIENLQIKLGRCAEKYRAAIPNSPSDKQALADYYETYNELVRVNGGIIALDPDAELPDDLMPKDYVDYWLT